MTTRANQSSVLSFYRGQSLDDAGRTLADVLALSDDALEEEHDYIQWLFPLTEPSQAVPTSPVLSKSEVEALRADSRSLGLFDEALDRMLAFYGFALKDVSPGEFVVERLPTFPKRSTSWLERSHNFKRLTRILKSLRLLGLDGQARALYAGLRAVYLENQGQVGAVTMDFWRRAVED